MLKKIIGSFLLFLFTPCLFAMSQTEIVQALNKSAHQHQYAAIKKNNANGLTWQSLLDPSNSGRIKSIQMKNDPNTLFVYAADAPKKIYRSLDQGKTWQALSLPTTGIVDFASIDQHRLLLLSYEEIYLSDDSGDHWYPSSKGASGIFNDVYVIHPKLIFILTNRYRSAIPNIYRSIDGGKSWSPANLGADNAQWYWDMAGRDHVLLLSGQGLNISTNDGEFWTQPALWADKRVFSPYFSAIAVNSQHDIYVVWESSIYKTNIHGDIWQKVSNQLGGSNKIEIDSQDRIYVQTHEGLYRSSDNGTTWELIFKEGKDFTLLDDGRILISTADGLLLSDVSQKNYQKLSFALSTSTIKTTIALNANDFFALDESRKLYRTKNGGKVWEVIHDNVYDVILFHNKIIIFCSSQLLASEDKGTTWTEVYRFPSDQGYHDGLSVTANGNQVWTKQNLDDRSSNILVSNDLTHWQPVLHAKPDDNFWPDLSFYAHDNDSYVNTGETIQFSNDNGKTWQILLDKLHRYRGLITGYQSKVILAAFPDAGIIKSIDGGKNWQLINNGLTDFDFNYLLALDENTYLLATDSGVFRTMDGGNNWQAENNGLDNSNVTYLFLNQDTLLASTKGSGVYAAHYSTLRRE